MNEAKLIEYGVPIDPEVMVSPPDPDELIPDLMVDLAGHQTGSDALDRHRYCAPAWLVQQTC